MIAPRPRLLHVAFRVMLLLGGVLTASRAFGNGRFPESHRLVEQPGDPNRLYIGATFGLLATSDRGKTWYHVCERAFAGEFLEGDPMLEVMPDGTVLSGLYNALNRSSDCGCAWQPVLGAAERESVWDITIDRGTGAIIALVEDASTSRPRSALFESTDAGRTWRKLSDLPVEIVNAFTVDVAPSDSSRIYVSGMGISVPGARNPGLLLVSSDHGSTWTTQEIAGASVGAYPYIAAVDSSNPDHLFVRTDEWTEGGEWSANDALLYSDDGGKTWRELIRRAAKLLGFAISPDNSTVLVGYGDPVQPSGHTVNADDMGVYKARIGVYGFDKILPGPVSCLRWTSTGVYVCLTEDHPDIPTPGMSLGFAPNADFTLATAAPLTSLLSTRNIKGPLACNASACLDNWRIGTNGFAPLCQAFRASCDLQPTNNVLSCSQIPGGARDAGSSNPDAGVGDAGPDSTSQGTKGQSGGCGCRVVAGPPEAVAASVSALLLWISGWQRRRRRSQVGVAQSQDGRG